MSKLNISIINVYSILFILMSLTLLDPPAESSYHTNECMANGAKQNMQIIYTMVSSINWRVSAALDFDVAFIIVHLIIYPFIINVSR